MSRMYVANRIFPVFAPTLLVMGASATAADGRPRRRSRWRTRVIWVVAALAFFFGLVALVQGLTFPRAIAKHPVRTEATISSVYINGLGGDPAVDYRYRVAGRVYTGWGTGQLGREALLELHPGDPVAIEYAG